MAEQQLQEKLREAKAKIVSNSKDAHFAQSLIEELVGLQKQADIEPTEIFIPLTDIEKSYDLGAVKISKVKSGKYIFEAKGGMWTIVDMRMKGLYGSCEYLCGHLDHPSEDDEQRALNQTLCEAMLYAFQAPIFCALDQRILLEVTTKLVALFGQLAEELMPKIATPETEEDVKKNIAFENVNKAVDKIVNTPIPDTE